MAMVTIGSGRLALPVATAGAPPWTEVAEQAARTRPLRTRVDSEVVMNASRPPAVPEVPSRPVTAEPAPVAPRPALARPPTRAFPRTLAVVVVTIVALGAALVLLARAFEHTAVATAVYRQPISRVVVGTGTGSIIVRAAPAGSPVTVRRTVRWSFGGATSDETVAGGVLTVTGQCGQDLGLGQCSVSYLLSVPAQTAVTLTTSTGSVQARDLAGDVQAITSTGSVDLSGLRAASVTAQTSTGSVVVRFAAPPTSVTAQTGTGSVEVVVPADATAYDVRATTSVGQQTVQVPVDSGSPHRIVVTASTGSVTVRSSS